MKPQELGLTQATLDFILANVSRNPKIEKAIIYGSRALKTYKPGSDVDMVIVGAALTVEDLFALENAFDESPLPYKFDLSILHQISNASLLDHIQRVGKVIYAKKNPPPTS